MTRPMEPSSGPTLTETRLPLLGVRVIDFSRLLPGPWCTQTLGDLGADVIKVEQPEIGDYSRFNPPVHKNIGVYFNSINRNKRRIVLDLTQKKDRAIADELTIIADVIVESFRQGVAVKLGIDYASVAKRKRSVIYCGSRACGNEPNPGRVPGHDLSIRGVAEILEKNRQPGKPPPMPAFQG